VPASAHVRFEPTLLGEAVESLAEGVVLLDTEGSIFYVNQAVVTAVGLPREAVIGLRWDNPVFFATTPEGVPIPPEERPFRLVMRSGQPVLGYEYDLRPPGREPISVILNAVPLRFENELIGVAVTLTDITARKKAEAALRDSEERFRAIVEQSRYGIVIASPTGEVLLQNDAMEQITGNPTSEILERGWAGAAFTNKAQLEYMIGLNDRIMSGELDYIEVPYDRRDGRKVWLSYSFTPMRLKGKDYLLAIVTDITQRQRAEERVRFQSSLLEQVREAILATDVEGRVTYVNDEAEDLLGWQRQDVVGKLASDLLPDDQLQESVQAEFRRVGRWEGEALYTRPDGRQIPLLVSLGKLRDPQGQTEGFVGLAIDITQQKAAQRALEDKDRAIRQAYVDVVGAVTGGKLVLMTEEELESVLGKSLVVKAPINPDSLCDSRHEVERVLAMEHTVIDPAEGVVAYGEAATNAIKHGGGGHYCIYREEHVVQVAVEDGGPGIDFRTLPRATLLPGFSTQASLGMGFTIMLDLADRVLLTTRPGCTEVVLEFAAR